ncbi:MAG: hypothetical protein ABIV63_12775 [Caldimonas sp.]
MDDDSATPTCGCGSETFERVTVSRSDGAPYATEFLACTHCRVMYHWPRPDPKVVHPEGPGVDDWAARYRKSVRR